MSVVVMLWQIGTLPHEEEEDEEEEEEEGDVAGEGEGERWKGVEEEDSEGVEGVRITGFLDAIVRIL